MRLINIDKNLSVPKYKQIILSIESAIAQNRLKRNEKLPSINKISLEFSLSRDTVLLAYDVLKKRGIIYSILGKGYFIKSIDFSFEQRIFLLFDELNTFKEEIYNAFLSTMNNAAQIDIFFHHFNKKMFQKLINESNGNYSKYIIMPTNFENAIDSIKLLPKDDVFILDQTNSTLCDYPSIHQNFKKNIYDSLATGKTLLEKYSKLILIFPGFREPLGMVEGFKIFCSDLNFENQIIESFDGNLILKGEVYIIPNDKDLVNVIEQAQRQNLIIGTDVGIISYNDKPLKKVVVNGITTISTDFFAMGKILATMILDNSKLQIENECKLIVRNSL
ncbi:MAG: GntR family transcriptional regulator [Flavobacterium sp.]|nr:GntR family transcriptional regulator [Flavobacterium sp.]